jgi:hypothetical protein
MMTIQGQVAGSTLVALLALSTFGASYGGASTFEAGVVDANCIAVTFGPSPASGSWTVTTNGTGIASASAFTFGGLLGGDASVSSLGNASPFNFAAACFKARMVIDDIVISGPGTNVSTQISAHLSGSIATSAGSVSGLGAVQLRAQTVGGAALSATAGYSTGGVNGQNSVDTTLTTASFTAPVGQPFAVRMTLESEISASDNAAPPNPVSGATQFEMRFIRGAPVFSLPAGYTANSGDGNIVDNQFVSPSVPALDTQATAALMARRR